MLFRKGKERVQTGKETEEVFHRYRQGKEVFCPGRRNQGQSQSPSGEGQTEQGKVIPCYAFRQAYCISVLCRKRICGLEQFRVSEKEQRRKRRNPHL